MMAESNNIFLAGGDALVSLAVKNIAQHVLGHPFSTYVSLDRFFNPSLPYKHMNTFKVTASAVGLFQKILLYTIAHMH